MEKDKCLAVCVSGCCPIEDEDGGFSHSHVCTRDEHAPELYHLCPCGKSWTEVRIPVLTDEQYANVAYIKAIE